VVIGSVFAWTLGLGALFLSIFTRSGSGGDGTAGVRVLFGSIFGLTARTAAISAILALLASAILLAIARPLVFASLDPLVAAAQGVPVRALGVVLLVLLGIVAAQASVAVGALLLLGLIAAPAGAAHRLVANPYRGLALSAILAVASVWIGLTSSYLVAAVPPSTAIVGAATAAYVVALVARPRARRSGQPEA
jgi:zinc/manganese transport system permease protein